MIKFLLKIWPALTPILVYIIWNLIKNKFSKRKNVIDADYKIINPENDEQISDFKENKSKESFSKFSLKNENFILTLYLTLISMIIMMIYLALK